MYRPVLAAMLLAALTGCSKKTRSDESTAPAAAPGDDLAALEQQLAQRESELQAVGVAPQVRRDAGATAGGGTADSADASADAPAPVASEPAPTSAPSPAAEKRTSNDGDDRCERVCEISAAICALEDQICGLLPRHRGDARYQAACDRAVADCQLATEACHACTAN